MPWSIVIVILLSVTCARAQAQKLDAAPGVVDWPQWRGPNGDGVSRETGWRTRFDDNGPKRLWTAKIGPGFASPVIGGGRLYLLSSEPGNLQKETVLCLDADTGKKVWQYDYELQSVKRASNPAGGTPALAGGRVFTYGTA